MRKQLLLGTTALMVGAMVAPSIAAAQEQPLRLEVRGYKNEFIGIGNPDDSAGTDLGNTNIFNDGEIHFRGETKLDNGLAVGVQVELEAFQSGDQIDESYAYIQGDFGKVVVGSENLANYNTFWAVTAPSVGVPLNSGWITTFVPAVPGGGFGAAGSFCSPLLTTNLDIGNDENAISYYSPRFAGFQFTGGFAPAVADNGDGQTAYANEGTQYYNAWGVGFNFSNSFNGFDLGVAAGYNQGSVDTARKAAGADDFQQVKVGANIGFAGFKVGGSYAKQIEGKVNAGTAAAAGTVLVGGVPTLVTIPGTAANTRTNEGQSYDIGASYTTGPWGASVTYFKGEQKDTIATPGDDKATAVVGAVSYALGPGITTSFSLMYGKMEDEAGAQADATVGVLGIAISF